MAGNREERRHLLTNPYSCLPSTNVLLIVIVSNDKYRQVLQNIIITEMMYPQ